MTPHPDEDAMSRPDPNGCKRCGLASCRACDETLLHVGEHEPAPHWTMGVTCLPGCPRCDAAIDCLSRPAVNWQAECRRLAAPAAVEVRGVVSRVGDGDAEIDGTAGPLGRDFLMMTVPEWPGAHIGQPVRVLVAPDGGKEG